MKYVLERSVLSRPTFTSATKLANGDMQRKVTAIITSMITVKSSLKYRRYTEELKKLLKTKVMENFQNSTSSRDLVVLLLCNSCIFEQTLQTLLQMLFRITTQYF